MQSLKGKLLVAMPGMGDPRFEKTVIAVCDHSDTGALGLVVNKPLPDIKTADLIEQLDLEALPDVDIGDRLFFGGPVEPGRGFVLHTDAYSAGPTTLIVSDGVAMTATIDVLEDIARGVGPTTRRVALGYSGWGPGQLESELQQNGWLTADATPDLVFMADADGIWAGALKSLGIDPLMLSEAAGRA